MCDVLLSSACLFHQVSCLVLVIIDACHVSIAARIPQLASMHAGHASLHTCFTHDILLTCNGLAWVLSPIIQLNCVVL
jgi:hypothetical protein